MSAHCTADQAVRSVGGQLVKCCGSRQWSKCPTDTLTYILLLFDVTSRSAQVGDPGPVWRHQSMESQINFEAQNTETGSSATVNPWICH